MQARFLRNSTNSVPNGTQSDACVAYCVARGGAHGPVSPLWRCRHGLRAGSARACIEWCVGQLVGKSRRSHQSFTALNHNAGDYKADLVWTHLDKFRMMFWQVILSCFAPRPLPRVSIKTVFSVEKKTNDFDYVHREGYFVTQ